MIVDVEDSMFAISALGGAKMTAPALNGLVSASGTPVLFITVQARDQYRPVRVNFSAPPSTPPLLDDFDAMAEFSVYSPTGLVVGDLAGEVQRVLTRASGDVRVRVYVKRGPIPRTEDRPSETFTIEAWPAPPAPTVVEDRAGPEEPAAEDRTYVRTARPGDLVESDELAAAGRTAGNALGERLDEPHGPQTGSCSATILLPGRRRRVFNRTAWVGGWLGGSGSWSGDKLEVGLVWRNRLYDPNNESSLNGTVRNGHIHNEIVELEPARRVVCHWNWYVPPDGQAKAWFGEQVPLLAIPTVLELVYTDEPTDDDTPWTRLALTHTHVPADWAPLLEAFWRWRCTILPWALARR